jgi:hypothetical protein
LTFFNLFVKSKEEFSLNCPQVWRFRVSSLLWNRRRKVLEFRAVCLRILELAGSLKEETESASESAF